MSRMDMWCREYITHADKRLCCRKIARHPGLHKTEGPDGTIEWSYGDDKPQ